MLVKKLASALAFFLLLNFNIPDASAIGVWIPKRVPKGAVYYLGNPIKYDILSIFPKDFPGDVSLVITTKVGGGNGWQAGEVSKSDFVALPLRLTTRDGKNSDYVFSVSGEANIESILGLWSGKTKTFDGTRFGDGMDRLTYWAAKWLVEAKVRASLKPYIRCEPLHGEAFCSLPEDGVLPIPSLYVRLHTSDTSYRWANELTDGGEIMGKVEFWRTCTFTVTNKTFKDIVISAKDFKKNDLVYGNMKTHVSIVCEDGKPPQVLKKNDSWEDPLAGRVMLRLDPVHGLKDPSKKMAKTDLNGLGLVYHLGQTEPTCNGESLEFKKAVEMKDMNLSAWTRNKKISKSSTINWALCQYGDKLNRGNFSTAVNYELWLE